MREIMAEDQAFVREEHSIDEGLALFADQPFKREIIEGVAGPTPTRAVGRGVGRHRPRRAPSVTTYRNDATTLRRPVPGPARALDRAARALQAAAGGGRLLARRRAAARSCSASTAPPGSPRRRWPTTCTAWRRPSGATTAASGPSSTCSRSPPEIGSGLAVFHPKGATIRRLMEDYSRQRHERGRLPVRLHAAHHQVRAVRDLGPPASGSPRACSRPWSSTSGQQYYLKPMNCPFHILIYRSRQRSYRELPMRLFEFGTVYRYEKSGCRARAHPGAGPDPWTTPTSSAPASRWPTSSTPCSPSSSTCCATSVSTTSTWSCPPGPRARRWAATRSGTRPPRRCAPWPRGMGLELVMDEGGGAFYGPKISVQARDAIGRHWQMSTIQLDFQLPAALRAGVRGRRQRPAPAGHDPPGAVRLGGAVLRHPPRALRRGAAHLAHARRRCVVLPVRDDHDAYAETVADALRAARAARRRSTPPTNRSTPGSGGGSSRRCPYILVVGDEDVAGGHGGGERPELGAPRAGRGARCLRGRRGGRDRAKGLARGRARLGVPTTAGAGGTGRVSLEQLWAGWRHEYVASATGAERAGTDDECVFCRIAASGRSERRERRRVARRAQLSPCSTPTLRQRASAGDAAASCLASWPS